MEKIAKKVLGVVPGFAMAAVIAVVARFLEGLLPIHLIGASVIAMFMGMIINSFWKPTPMFASGIKFTSKKVLKFAIILLGAGLNTAIVLNVGKMSLCVMFFTLLTCFGGGYFIGRALGIDWKLSNLISAGTGICGGSAIAAIAPVIDADDSDVSYAISATFIFDMAMIVLFPIMGHALGLTDEAYGLWAGTAVNDTSSVVAAGYAFSEAGGEFAAMVKLTRTLAIIPTVVAFALVNAHVKHKSGVETGESDGESAMKNVHFTKIIPWFILGFLALSVLNSIGLIPEALSSSLKNLSKFLMVCALAAIGLNTSFKDMKKSGIAPMVHGFIISALVVIVAIAVEYFMGLV